jgi:hypothetical protein
MRKGINLPTLKGRSPAILGDDAMASFQDRSGAQVEPISPAEISVEEVRFVRDMVMVRLNQRGWPQDKIALFFNRSRPLVNQIVNSIPPDAVADIRGLWP